MNTELLISAFAPPSPDLCRIETEYANLCQIRQIGRLCLVEGNRKHLIAFLLQNSEIVDRLCKAYGLRGKGSTGAGVQSLLLVGARLAENVPGDC